MILFSYIGLARFNPAQNISFQPSCYHINNHQAKTEDYKSGYYWLNFDEKPIVAFCDLQHDGGMWQHVEILQNMHFDFCHTRPFILTK